MHACVYFGSMLHQMFGEGEKGITGGPVSLLEEALRVGWVAVADFGGTEGYS